MNTASMETTMHRFGQLLTRSITTGSCDGCGLPRYRVVDERFTSGATRMREVGPCTCVQKPDGLGVTESNEHFSYTPLSCSGPE